MFSVFFSREGDRCATSPAPRARTPTVQAFFHAMLDQGVYLPPSAFEAWFLSAAHDDRALAARPRRAARGRAAAAGTSDGSAE